MLKDHGDTVETVWGNASRGIQRSNGLFQVRGEPMTRLDSATLNQKIADLDAPDDDDLSPNGSGKAVPYIGWFWREVDFDAEGYEFGVIPGEFIGFMENNKWDYGYTRKTSPEEWAEIKRLIGELVNEPTKERAGAVWGAIQAVGNVPIRCSDKKPSGIPGMIVRCIQPTGHDGEHVHAL